MYKYAKLSADWNLYTLHMKLHAQDLEPKYINANPEYVWLYYDAELPKKDKDHLDVLMKDKEIGLYPKSSEGYTIIKIADLLENWTNLETSSKLKIKWIFANVPFSDRLELWLEGELTETEIEKLKLAYTQLFAGRI